MSFSPRPLDRLGVFIVIGLCASWGFNQVAAKVALSEIPPLTQAAARSLCGALLLGTYALWRDPRLFVRDGSFWAGIFCGLLFGLEFIFLYLGLQKTSASHAILFLYTAPFFVALGLTWVVPNERLTPMQWAGLALSFMGVGLALGVSSASPDMLWGDALCLAAGAAWGMTTLVVKATPLRLISAEKTLLYQLIVSVFVIGGAALLSGESAPGNLSPLVAIAFAYQVLWIVCVTFLVWFWMVKHYRAGELSAFTFLTPLFGVAAGVLLLGDQMSAAFTFAVMLVAAGIVMVNWPTKKAA